MTRNFNSEIEIEADINEVFDFFADPINLEKITPSFLNFKLIDPIPEKIEEGTKIYYKLKIRGVPVKWITLITKWNPPYEFVDTQLKGPYRQWIHTHKFEKTKGGVLIQDNVDYKVPGWFLEPLIHKFFVRSDIEKIFKFRNSSYQNFIESK